MQSIEEINIILNQLEDEKFPVQVFREKWKALLFPRLLEMVFIPADSFRMGSDQYSDTMPIHRVKLSAYEIAGYPVTFKQWTEVREWAEMNGYVFSGKGQMGGGKSQLTENHPVTRVSWYDAVLWCNALSEKEGRIPCYYVNSSRKEVYRYGRTNLYISMVRWDADGYRLPTEAEWEYACRAGITSEYSCGDETTKHHANYSSDGTTRVGIYEPNVLGLYDMHGNVWEWCWDIYNQKYYRKSPNKNPRGPSSGSYRVIRGGGWRSDAASLRSASREPLSPDQATGTHGFRPVSKAEEKEKD